MKILIKSKLSPHKYKDNSGYLICQDSILARTGKQSYMRSELFPEDAAKGNDEVIEVDRKPEQVFADATLASFENKPLTIEHPSENVTPDNYKEYSAGFVRDVRKGKSEDGQDVIIGNIVVTDPAAIEAIESGEMTDLSCGYDCDITDGDHPEQINIRGNHVALCQQGRAGIAKIVDSVDKLNKRKIIDSDDEDEKGASEVIYKFTVVKQFVKDIEKLFSDDILYEDKVKNGVEFRIWKSADLKNYLNKNNISFEKILCYFNTEEDEDESTEVHDSENKKKLYTVFNNYGKWCGADYSDYHGKSKEYNVNNLPYAQLEMNIKYIVNRLGIAESEIEIVDEDKYVMDSLDYSNELYEKIIKELKKKTNSLNKQTLDEKKAKKSGLLERNYNESKINVRSEINSQLRYFEDLLDKEGENDL